MNTLKIKNWVASNAAMCAIAEKILDIYTVIRRKMTGSYTRDREDAIIMQILKEHVNKAVNEIKYVDIGASNYRRGNNSYLFYEHGARGLLIEANPLLCKSLESHRSGDEVINCCIGRGGV